MMFFGPEGRVAAEEDLRDWSSCKVTWSTTGMSHSSNSRPMSRSIQGKAFSWPTATSTSSHSIVLVRLAGRDQLAAALVVVLGADLLEHHAGQLAVLVGECLGHQEVEDRDVLVHRVFLLPGRRLHLLEAGADDHLDVLAAQAARGAAAVHGGVAAAQHDHPLADLVDVAERDAGQPVDADMDVGRGFLRGPGCRGRGRAARRSRRRSRRSPAPAAPSGCRSARPAAASMPRPVM